MECELCKREESLWLVNDQFYICKDCLDKMEDIKVTFDSIKEVDNG